MVNVRKDLTNQRFGRLIVVEQVEDYIAPNIGKHYAQWLCECDCENHTRLIVQQSHLKDGHTVSCGCYNKDKTREANKKANEYRLLDDYGVLWTTNTRDEVYFDLSDAENILQYCWTKDCEGYPSAFIDTKRMRLHTFLGLKWHDHQNRNKLDNRRQNLRPCTYSQNGTNKGLRSNNTSGVTGVYWFARDKKWKSQINIDGKIKSLGTFINKKDAIIARLVAEAKYYKAFAPQHHLFAKYGVKYETD